MCQYYFIVLYVYACLYLKKTFVLLIIETLLKTVLIVYEYLIIITKQINQTASK